jgi:hypothetical protein
MKVFVGFGYNEKDKWINDLIIPFIKELGCEVVTGEEMQGEELTAGVINRINDCDACIGFLTKRGKPDQDGVYSTHWWVISELTTALVKEKAIFEIREKGIDPQKGIAGNRQRYEFEDKDKALLMLEITKFIMKEKSKLTYKTFMLLPTNFAEEIRPHIKSRDTRCTYSFLYQAKIYEPEETKLVRLGQGGFGIIITKIPSEEAQIEIIVEGPGGISWNSGFVSVGLMNIQLQKES